MKSLRLRDGDLVLGTGHRLEAVSGQDKLAQDVRVWLLEPKGAGPTTPLFGSLLDDMIGQGPASDQADAAADEVERVVGLYQATQLERIRADRDAGLLGRWSRSEVLNEVVSVEADEGADRVVVTVLARTLGGGDLRLDVSSTPEGVA